MNRNKIFQTFYDKLPDSMEQVMPEYDRCKLITCLNPHYMICLEPKDYDLYNHFDFICSDGMGPLKVQKVFGKKSSPRLSFDASTLAGPVFRDAIAHEESLYVLGAKDGEVDKSVETFKNNYRGLKIAGFHHGYIKECKDEVVKEIIESGAKIVIIGMGAPTQDEMCIRLKNAGFVGTVYTCGGFIHQTQECMVSFPAWTNKLGLRWLYRIFTQKGVFKRFMSCIPLFVISYSWFMLTGLKEAK